VQCVVPNVVGLTLGAAARALTAHHCTVGTVTKVSSTRHNKGRVLRESPPPGKHLRRNAKVALWVGRGPRHR
jgi:beta-lactam-binding protein with PASTA domain